MKKQIIKNKFLHYVIILTAGLLLGWLVFGTRSESADEHTEHAHETTNDETWTCSMHPQIRQQEPGDCPICGMDLIPLETDDTSEMPDVITLSDHALALANVQTTTVHRAETIEKEIRLQGKIEIDERRISAQPLHFPGRIENLYVTFEGAEVKKGQKLADVYSPELVSAQQELLEALRLEGGESVLATAARNKLRLWKVDEDMIDEIVSNGEVREIFPVFAHTSGIVTERKVSVGDYLNAGEVMFEIVDLNRLWVLLDAYQEDIPFIEVGDKIEIDVSSLTDKKFTARISYIDPVIDPQTRVADLRAEIGNPDGMLKPEMFAWGIVQASLEIAGNEIVVPSSAIMWTGKRSIVYVQQQKNDQIAFNMREVALGEKIGSSYLVQSGLNAGEAVVTHGTFTVDAAAQLANKSSMMNQDAQVIQTSGHHHEHALMTDPEGEKETFFVAGNCGMCKDRIEKAVTGLDGIHSASWSVEDKMLTVAYHPEKVDLMDIHHTVADVGHDTRKVRAEDEVYENLHSCCKYERIEQTDEENLKSESFKVYGNCGMCKDRIESTAMELAGVQDASWSQQTNKVEITFHPEKVDLMDVQKAIAQAGHDTEKVEAPDEVYEDLPGCCQYTRE